MKGYLRGRLAPPPGEAPQTRTFGGALTPKRRDNVNAWIPAPTLLFFRRPSEVRPHEKQDTTSKNRQASEGLTHLFTQPEVRSTDDRRLEHPPRIAKKRSRSATSEIPVLPSGRSSFGTGSTARLLVALRVNSTRPKSRSPSQPSGIAAFRFLAPEHPLHGTMALVRWSLFHNVLEEYK